MGRAVTKMRRAFEEWLQRRDSTYDRFRAVKIAKKYGGLAMGERLENYLDHNKKMLWKEVKQVRKGEQARDEIVKDVNA